MKSITFVEIKSLITSLIMLISVMSINAQKPIDTYEDDNFKYTLTRQGIVTIVEYIGTTPNVVIPDKIMFANGEHAVRRMEDSLFAYNRVIESITLPSGLDELGKFAFGNCINLKEVNLKKCSKLTNLDDFAFWGCANLKKVTLPSSVSSIGQFCFYMCFSLEQLIDYNPLIQTGQEAFNHCYSLDAAKEWIDYSNDTFANQDPATFQIDSFKFAILPGIDKGLMIVEYLGDDADVLIPDSVPHMGKKYAVTAIADEVFKDRQLKYAFIGRNIQRIGNRCFMNCRNLQSVNFKLGTRSIGEDCFRNCVSLSSINVPVQITHIARGTFAGCTSLRSATLNDRIEYVGPEAFIDCGNLSSIELSRNTKVIYDDSFPQTLEKLIFTNGCNDKRFLVIKDDIQRFKTYTSYRTPTSPPDKKPYPNTLLFASEYDLGAFINDKEKYYYEEVWNGRWDSTVYHFDRPFYYNWSYLFKGCNLQDSYLNKVYSLHDIEIGIGPENAFDLSAWIFDYPGCTAEIPQPLSFDEDIASVEGNFLIGHKEGRAVLFCFNPNPQQTTQCVVTVKGNLDGISFTEIDIENEDPSYYTIHGVPVGHSKQNLSPGIYIEKRGSKTKKLLIP